MSRLPIDTVFGVQGLGVQRFAPPLETSEWLRASDEAFDGETFDVLVFTVSATSNVLSSSVLLFA